MELHGKTIDELSTIARKLGIKGKLPHDEAKLRGKITALLYPDELEAAAGNGLERIEHGKRGEVIKHNTDPDTLRAEIARRFPKLALAVDSESWRVNLGVAEDSGPLAMPIGVILLKAEAVAGARLPAKFKGTGTDLDGALA